MQASLRTLDGTARSLWTRYDSSTESEAALFCPTPDNAGRLAAEAAIALRRLSELEPAPDGPATVETVLCHQLRDALEVISARLRDDAAFPNRHVQKISGRVSSLLDLDEREPGERAAVLAATFDQGPAVVATARELAEHVDEQGRELFAGALASLAGQLNAVPGQLERSLPGLSGAEVDALARGARALAADASAHKDALEALPLLAPGQATQRMSYEETLRSLYGIKLEDLVAWHRQEVERCDREFREFAARIGPGRNPFDILVEDSPPYPTADEMYPAIEGFLKLARAKTLEYMPLPEGEVCKVRVVPEHLRHSYPWGGYWGGNSLRGDLYGAVFLNRYNYREITRAWIQMNAVHESYPGHHVHAVRTAAGDMPACFKLGTLTSRGAPLSEGVAHRSETLLRGIFGEPAYELFVLYRRLHTAVRIWADLELFHFGGGVQAAVGLYQKYLGFAEQVARGQVLAQRWTPGYFTVYYYGMRDLERLQAEIGWDDKPFTDLIFSCGKASLGVLRKLIELGPNKRAAMMTAYSTL